MLDGSVPRLIDEWQAAVPLWNRIRREVDARKKSGQFILTGSATPADDLTRHTGAMRFGRVRMRPMSLSEAGTSTGAVSLADALNGAATASPDPGLTVRDLIEAAVRCGRPGIQGLAVADAAQAVRDHLEQVSRAEISTVDGVRRDPARVQTVLRSLARHTATQRTCRPGTPTYVQATNCEAARPGTSSIHRSVLRRSARLPTRCSRTSTSSGCCSNRLSSATCGSTARRSNGAVHHYRDQTGLEVDAIVDAGERWGAFEVKLGGHRVDEAAAHLTRFAQRIDITNRGPAAILAVIVGTGYGYVRPDGIHVIPIGALGP